MAKVVLYRKYRALTFDEIIGQDNIVKTVRQALLTDQVGHAYLLAGPRGVGKTSLARILSRAVNCLSLDEKGNPCNQCEVCQAFLKQASLDLIEVDAASHRGIDDIRFLQEGSSFVPVLAKKKVFIIDEVHMLTKEAFNALLKTLEEPPAHLLFILATTEIDKVPETVLSRCQIFVFNRLARDTLAAHLEKVAGAEGREIEPKAAELIAKLSYGGGRDALGMLEQVLLFTDGKVTLEETEKVLGLISEDILSELTKKLWGEDIPNILEYYFREIYDKGLDIYRLMDDWEKYIRELLLKKYTSSKTDEEKLWLEKISLIDLVSMLDVMAELKNKKYDLDSLYFEMLVYKYKIIRNNDEKVEVIEDKVESRKLVEKKTVEKEPDEIKKTPVEKKSVADVMVDQEKWIQIVEEICRLKPVVGSMLKMAKLQGQDGDKIIVDVPFALQKDRLLSNENYQAWEEACKKVLGEKLKLDCQVNNHLQNRQEKKEKMEKSVQEKINKDLGLDLLENVVEVFEGKIVK